MLDTIIFSTTDGGMLVCVKPLKINFNKTTIWQKCKSLCSLRLHFLSSGHPCALTGQALFRNHVLDLIFFLNIFWSFFLLHLICTLSASPCYRWKGLQILHEGIHKQALFHHQHILLFKCLWNISQRLLEIFLILSFCVTDGMLSLGNSQAFIMSLTKTNYS